MEEEDHLQSFLVLSVPPASSQPGRSAAGLTKPEAEDVDGTSGSVSAAAAGQEELSLSDVDMVDSRIVDKGKNQCCIANHVLKSDVLCNRPFGSCNRRGMGRAYHGSNHVGVHLGGVRSTLVLLKAVQMQTSFAEL